MTQPSTPSGASTPFRTPAVIGLIAVFGLSLVALQALSRSIADAMTEMNSIGQATTEEELAAVNELYTWWNTGYMAVQTLGLLAAASALALVFVWCYWPRGAAQRTSAPAKAQSSEGTRMMSEAGSTVNLADTTVPNSSPSISNSSEPSTISMSTDRPRE